MQCPNCQTQEAEGTRFCSNCGQALSPVASTVGFQPGRSAYVPATVISGLEKEGLGGRIFGYLIDIVPTLLLSLLHFLPILGWMMFGLLTGCYWLLRDINGASLGKNFVGSVVLSADGSPSITSQRIIRNIPIALAALLEMIPIVGILVAFIALVIILPIELLLLLFGGRRLGDLLAGTNVFRKGSTNYPVTNI